MNTIRAQIHELRQQARSNSQSSKEGPSSYLDRVAAAKERINTATKVLSPTNSDQTLSPQSTTGQGPMSDMPFIITVDPQTGIATCGGPQPETPSVTSDQTNTISGPINIDPTEEKKFGQYKVDFFSTQEKDLAKVQKQLTKQFRANPKNQETKDQLLSTTYDLKQVNDAKKFWSKIANFWDKLDKVGLSAKNQDQIDKLTAQLTQLENQMDQILPGDASKNHKHQVRDINKQVASIQSQITRLHTEI